MAAEDVPQLDTRHAHPARIYNYWLGGKDNFAADREAAEQAIAANPRIVTDVLFGGFGTHALTLGDTWTWGGTNWTKQAPATNPPGRESAVMAYDAATGTDVLFGGQGDRGNPLPGTWTWG